MESIIDFGFQSSKNNIMTTSNEKNVAVFTHLSSLTQYFIPFGNFIFPIILWSSKKNESEFVDEHGKSVLNFQLSIFLYTMVIALIAIPVFVYNVLNTIPADAIWNDNDQLIEQYVLANMSGFIILLITAAIVFAFLKMMEFILIIYASMKASNGEKYRYPLTIRFFK